MYFYVLPDKIFARKTNETITNFVQNCKFNPESTCGPIWPQVVRTPGSLGIMPAYLQAIKRCPNLVGASLITRYYSTITGLAYTTNLKY